MYDVFDFFSKSSTTDVTLRMSDCFCNKISYHTQEFYGWVNQQFFFRLRYFYKWQKILIKYNRLEKNQRIPIIKKKNKFYLFIYRTIVFLINVLKNCHGWFLFWFLFHWEIFKFSLKSLSDNFFLIRKEISKKLTKNKILINNQKTFFSSSFEMNS